MGYSPGDFKTRDGKQYHIELKDGPRVVLWTDDEMTKILDLDAENASALLDQLRTVLAVAGVEEVL